MKLNHLNICTTEVNAAAELFVKHFGFKRSPAPAGNTLAVLHDEAGFSLLFSNFSKATQIAYPEGFHFGFILGSREQVDETHARLKADGFAVNPPRAMHGSWTFYFNAPGGFLVEVQSPA